jgi:hypothetical protein
MNALHQANTEQRRSSSTRKAHSQQDDSSYSATDDSDDDNLPLVSKGRIALTTRMAITRAAQQSRPRDNVQTSSHSRANKIPHDSKFSRPLPAIRKGGTSDKTKNKKKTNSKKRDKDGPLDGSRGVGASTTAPPGESNNNDLQPSYDNEPPSDGVMGDQADARCVSMNVVTDEISNKKSKSTRKKKDNAEVFCGNEIHQGSPDDLVINDTSVMDIITESKKDIVLVSKDVMRKMIELLSKEGMSDNSPVNLLRNLIPYEEYLLLLAGELDNSMIYVDDAMHKTTITELVNRTFESFSVSVEGMFESNEDGMLVDVVRLWQLLHALNVNSVAFGNFIPPSEVVDTFYNRLKPLFEKATASVKRTKIGKSNSSKTAEKSNNEMKEVSHHNDSKRSVVIDGQPFKCNGVKVKGDSVKTYTKYFQCNMVLDQSDGSKWKPNNEVAKRSGKNVYPLRLIKCEGTMLGIFTAKNGKPTQQFIPGSKPHICYNRSFADGVPMETRVPMIVIVSSSSWNLDRHAIESMKTALSNVSKKWWVNQANCGSKRQYLKELSSEKSLELVRKQAESFVGKYMRNFVSKMYPSLTHFKVGALRSRGDQSQFDLQGTLHRDYLDDVDRKMPEERPQSIIIALDPFVLVHENYGDYHDDPVGFQSVAKGEAILFTSSLRHAGGSNGNKEDKTWKYRLFAYIVSEVSDFPSEVTRLNLN